jgi:hypothetical protein
LKLSEKCGLGSRVHDVSVDALACGDNVGVSCSIC